METFWHDLRYGARILLTKPGFTLIAVVTLALGIGANTAIFSVVNAVLLRPLPYEHSERLVRMMHTDANRNVTGESHSFPNFADLRAQNDVFEAMAAYHETDGTLVWNGTPERIGGLGASADLFKVLGTQAHLGRTFLPTDEQPGGAPAVVISHGVWQRRFASDPQIVGRQITLNGKSKTIIGVLPAGFQFPFVNDLPEYFTPLNPRGEMEVQRGANYLRVIGRLKEGVGIERAEAAMRTIAARLEQQYPEEDAN